MAGKKKVGKTKDEKPAEPEVTVGEGDEVEVEEAIPEVASIKVRSAKGGVKMMTPSQYEAHCKERDKK